MLELDGIRLRQGDFSLEADLRVAKGARTAVIGPSGAGKSTLLNLIAGFMVPEAGRIRWDGQDITAMAPGARPLSMLFQDGNLFPHLTIARNLALGIRPSGRLSPEEEAALARALSRVGLAEKGARRPGELSGGEQSRAALARALLRQRPMLLLDEPFAALGPALKADMLDLVGELAEAGGTTLLMITHDPADARRLCPETVLVAEGRAHPPVPTATLLDSPPPALAAYLGKSGG